MHIIIRLDIYIT